jgi:Mn-dependent DtxR family transcriptional regulator
VVLTVLIDADDVLNWIRERKESFVNSRKVAKRFRISTKTAGQILKRLSEKGYLKLHRRRRGRFNIYKVRQSVLGLRGKARISRIRKK